MAKKSKKGKKAKKAKKAVVAKKKSAKKASKKAAKKSAKKGEEGCQEGRKEIRQEGRQEVKGRRAEEGCKEEPGEEKEGGCQARRSRRRSPRWRRPSRRRARTGAELGYPGAGRTLMGVRLVQRRRPQLDGRPPERIVSERPQRPPLRPFSCAAVDFPRRPRRIFTGRLIRKMPAAGSVAGSVLFGSSCRLVGHETA